MTTNRERRNRRGSALMLTYFAAVVLSFMVAYGFKSSLDAGKTSEAVATTEQADYAAEYGANLAVSMLSQVALANGDAIGKDWVEAGIFDSGQPKGSDQRRIGGTLGDYDFRVQVRSADLALANNTMPASWLSRDSGSGGSRELMSRNPYKNTYEILATARKRNFSGAVASAAATSAPANTGTTGGYTANDAYTAKVYGIVGMKFGDNPAGLSEPFTTFNADQGTISVGTNNRNDQNHATTFTQPSEEQVAAVFDVDGEDHLLNTVYPKLELSSSKTEIVGAQRGQLKKAGQSIAATGGYWAQGNLTLNFMADSRPVNYKEILTATTHRGVGTPARPNPYVPLTRTFDYTYTDTNTGHDDRQMTSKYKQFNNNDTNNNDDFYTKDFYHNNVGDKAVLPVEQRLSPTSNPPLALDRYFLGGKRTSGSTDSNSGNGRSVTLQTFNGGEVYSLGKDVLDDVLYKGTKSGETYSGVIAQKHVDGLIKIDDPNSKLDVLVGSYVELKRFYMTYVPDWRTVFVGEWTNGTRKPTDSKSSADNMLFDNNGGTLRKRSFSKHYPMNKDGKILVHEMKWYNTSANSIVETGTSGEARVWTGRYKWVKPNFKNKFWVLDEKGKKVYPREFTWEEITGQKSKRATTGKLSGSDYGTYEAEVDESGALVSIKKMDSSVVRDGYPVTDILGREVPEVKADASGQDVLRDENGTPIFVPAGLTEYCSVNASDPSELIPVYFDNTSIDEYGIPEVVKQTGPSPITTNGYNNKTRQFARRNFIEVVEDDGSIRYYNDISDFEYLSDVTLEDGTVQKDRRVATIAIGMEDNYEEKSDFDYTDIMFVLNVVPAQDTTTTVIRGDNNESSKFIQWWELPTDAGLTGGPSQTPLSSTETPASKVAPQDERIAANYDHLVGSSDITATSLLDGDTGLEISYHRIKFDGNGEIVRPDDYQSGEIIYYYLAKNASVAGNDIDPDNYDDIFEFVSQELQQSDSKDEYKSCNTDMERKQRGLARLLKQADTKGLTLKDIDARGAPEKRSLAELPDQPTFTGASENDYLYNIREERYTARQLAFGGDGVTIAVGNTDAALNRERGDDNIMRPASREQHLFLAGEVAPKQRYEDDAPEPRPVLHRIMRQPVNSYVPGAAQETYITAIRAVK